MFAISVIPWTACCHDGICLVDESDTTEFSSLHEGKLVRPEWADKQILSSNFGGTYVANNNIVAILLVSRSTKLWNCKASLFSNNMDKTKQDHSTHVHMYIALDNLNKRIKCGNSNVSINHWESALTDAPSHLTVVCTLDKCFLRMHIDVRKDIQQATLLMLQLESTGNCSTLLMLLLVVANNIRYLQQRV